MRSRCLALLVLCLTLLPAWRGLAQQESPEPRSQPRLIAFELEDQFERTWTDADYRDRVVLAIATGRKSKELAEDWGDAIDAEFANELETGELAVLAVASLKGIPGFLKGSVRGRFPENRERWVMLDWRGEFAEAYGLDTDVASLLLFDRSGTLLSAFPTEAVDDTQLALLRAQIHDLLSAPATGR